MKPYAPRLAAVILAVLCLGVSACSWFGPSEREEAAAQRLCPRVGVLGEANHVTRFRQGGGDARDVLFEADIVRIQSRCEMEEDEFEIALEIAIEMNFARGPAQPTPDISAGYFVAVAATNGRVYDRQVFNIAASFEGAQTRGSLTEVLEYSVFPPEGLTSSEMVIYVGFDLTPQEVRFNRQRRRI